MDRVRVLYVGAGGSAVERRARRLARRGFETATAAGGAAGRRHVETHPVDCVVVGPGLSTDGGLAFLEWLRDEHPELPVVVSTDGTGGVTAARALAAGATDFVSESDLDDSLGPLVRRIERAVGGGTGQSGKATGGHGSGESPDGELLAFVRQAIGVEEASGDDPDTSVGSESAGFEWTAVGGEGTGFEWTSLDSEETEGTPEAGALTQLLDGIDWESQPASPRRPASGEDGPEGTAGTARDGTEEDPETGDSADSTTASNDPGSSGGATAADGPPSGSHEGPGGVPSPGGVSREELAALPREELLGLLGELLDDREGTSDGRPPEERPGGAGQDTGRDGGTNDEERSPGDEGGLSSAGRDRRDTPGPQTDAAETDTGEAVSDGADDPETGVGGRHQSGPGTDGPRDTGDGQPAERRARQQSARRQDGRQTADDGAEGGELVETGEYERPGDLELAPGTSVLVQCGSQDGRAEPACTDLLELEGEADRNVLLVRYRQMDEGRLEQIARKAARTKLLTIGYTQPLPQSVGDSVESVKINNPNDVTRLGIVVTGTMDEWESTPAQSVVCYDPLDVLLRYKNVKSAFRFLHLFLGKLQSAGAVSHFHVDPSAGDPQEINTLKPLFDAVVTIDSVGTHVERQ